jgi:hypothetical protein
MELFPRRFPGQTEVNHETLTRIASVPAQIRTDYFPNTSVRRYGKR